MNNAWSLSVADVEQQLGTDGSKGLTASAVRQRQADHGPNRLPAAEGRSWLRLLGSQFLDWTILLLTVAAIISGVVGEISDTILIALIVFANAFIGFAQEWKAEKAIEALKRLSQAEVVAIRDGNVERIPSEELVPGDVIRLSAGDSVPADGRIIEEHELEIDEAPLTGESLPVEKSTASVSESTELPDRASMMFSGTAISAGRGVAIVTDIGASTELGRIAELLNTAVSGPTPMQRRLARLSGQLAILVVVVCAVIFATGVLRVPRAEWTGDLFSGMLLTAVSLAVAAIPEGLPAIVTVTLALGAQRMVRRHAIVRRLSAVETLGSVDVICTDKTGTLTRNTMTAVDVIPATDTANARNGLLTAGVLCNDARLNAVGDVVGSATETALIHAGVSAGLAVPDIGDEFEAFDEIAFSSERKRMSTFHRSDAGDTVMLVKGAAERVLERCHSVGFLDPGNLTLTVVPDKFNGALWEQRCAESAGRGHRVLAIAARRWPADENVRGNSSDPETDLTLLGLVAIQDPLRPEVPAAVARCQSAGIRVVMITGDHRDTASAIATEAGIHGAATAILTGTEIEDLSDDDLIAGAANAAVFARVAPEHKLRIVRAMQAQGSVVAMTGDGVNDGPALKQAEIGVAMGITGTDVARESAEMILADDNFSTIVSAVEEGRVVYDNIRKFVAYLLAANTGEVLVLFVAILLGWPLPLLPIHILWINLVTDGLPALALGFEAAESNIMRRRPRGRDPSMFDKELNGIIVGMGLVSAIVSLGVFIGVLSFRGDGGDALSAARTACFTTLAASQLFLVLSIRSSQRTLFSLGFWSNYRLAFSVVLGLALQTGVISLPPLRRLFHTASLSMTEIAFSVAAAIVPYAVLEISKWVRFGRGVSRD
jgi:P-type Ca2+ transporter type 2C